MAQLNVGVNVKVSGVSP